MPLERLSPSRVKFSQSLTDSEVDALFADPAVRVIQFSEPVERPTFARLEKRLFARRTGIEFRAFAHYGTRCDLSFLQDVPSVEEFSADCLMEVDHLESLAGLKKLRRLHLGIYRLSTYDFLESVTDELEALRLGETRRKLQVTPLGRFRKLKHLALHGNTKDLRTLPQLTELRRLELLAMKAPDLSTLAALPRLERLTLIGGSSGDLAPLGALRGLRHLDLSRILRLSDLSPLSRCESLETLDISWQPQVRRLPEVALLPNFRAIYLETMKGIETLEPLGKSSSLEYVLFAGARHLEPEDFKPVLEAPRLKGMVVGFGSDRKNKALEVLQAARGIETKVPALDQLRGRPR